MGTKPNKEKTYEKAQLKYIEHFLATNCAAELLNLKLFPNMKEITESWGCFEATHKLESPFNWDNPEVTCVVVGDGHRPRTGAMFAFRTKWSVISIDPEFHPKTYNVDRLSLIKRHVQNCSLDLGGRPTILVLPHSHANWENITEGIKDWGDLAIISLPCCVKFNIPFTPMHQYDDMAILSPMRQVSIFQIPKGKQ